MYHTNFFVLNYVFFSVCIKKYFIILHFQKVVFFAVH